MAKFEKVELTNVCLIYKGDEYLLQKRTKKDWLGYALPGGHVEKGESFIDSVIREMKEETGLDIKNPKLCGIKQFPPEDAERYVVILYKTDEFEGEISSSDEGKVEWVKKEDLKKLDTVSDLEKMIEMMLDDEKSEFQYVVEKGEWIPIIK